MHFLWAIVDAIYRLVDVNSVQVAFGLIGNLSLLLNMARRLKFAVAQTITITGFSISALILIALTAVADTDHFRILPRDNHALSQAFYYAIIAAIVYSIIAILMVITVVGAYKGHYEKEFRLTVSQRTLMLQTIAFMVYLLLGALIWSEIEGWNYLDAVYWADFTLLTVGIGSPLTPQTHLGRGLLFPYAIGGIVTVGLVVGSIRSLVLERGKHKMETRMTEKKREQTLKSYKPKKRTIKMGWSKIEFNQEGLSEIERRRQEFDIMRRIQNAASSRRKWMSLIVSTLAFFALWLIGAVVFEQSERQQGWSYFVSMYFAYTSLLTIGYGDLQPQSNSGRPFFVFWSLLAVPTLTILISNMGDTVVKAISDLTIWVGSFTVLPGEGGIRASLKEALRSLTRPMKTGQFKTSEPPGFLAGSDHKGGEQQSSIMRDHALYRVSKHMEDQELEEAKEADAQGDRLDRDIHFYHFVLIREIRNVMKDVEQSPPKQYSYGEWSYFLRLIGEDERDTSTHRAPPVRVRRQHGARGEVSWLTATGETKDRTESMKIGDGSPVGDNDDGAKWSWLGTRSPLMGNKSEAEWILEKLTVRLEEEMRNLRKGVRDQPPISMTELVRGRSESSDGNANEEKENGNGRGGQKED